MNKCLLTCSALAVSLLAGHGFAQQSETNSSSSSKSVIVVSRNGKTYKKVIENGKVVEESGDKSLGKDVDVRIGTGGTPDLDGLIDRVRRSSEKAKSSDRAKSSESSSSSDSSRSAKSVRRVVVNGKTIVDEESDDVDLRKLDLPKDVRELLDGATRAGGDLDVGKLVERVRRSADTSSDKTVQRIFVDSDGHTVLEGDGAFETLELKLPAEISELFDGKRFDLDKMIHKALRGGGDAAGSRGRFLVIENGETVLDEVLDGIELEDFEMPRIRLEGVDVGDIEVEVSEHLQDLLRDAKGSVKQADKGDDKRGSLRLWSEPLRDRSDDARSDRKQTKKLERRVRASRDRDTASELEQEVKRLRDEIKALRRKLEKLDRDDTDREQFA